MTFHAPYLPSVTKALHAIQDADSCLLGVHAPSRQSLISSAMSFHRAAARSLSVFLSGEAE